MQLGRQTDCFSSHGTHILPLFDSSGISLVWLSYKSVDFDWIEIYIISSWEFWKLIAHCPESVISLFYIHSRINLDMLPHIAALDVFSIRFWIKQKSHNKRCIDNCYLAMVKKRKEHPDPHVLFLSSPSKMKEILSYLTRSSHSIQCQENASECIYG